MVRATEIAGQRLSGGHQTGTAVGDDQAQVLAFQSAQIQIRGSCCPSLGCFDQARQQRRAVGQFRENN